MVEAASSAKLERDELQRHVFPRLRKLREANNARFQAIELRWGVPDEAKAEGKVLPLCLQEIKRCRPVITWAIPPDMPPSRVN